MTSRSGLRLLIASALLLAGCALERSGLAPADGATPPFDAEIGRDGQVIDGQVIDDDAGRDSGVDGCTPGPELCNGVDDDCNGLIDDTLPGCEPPDAGPPPVDSGMPFEDASTPPPDAGFADAGARECVGENCYPLSGRAGPIGRCNCRAAGSGGSPWPATAVSCGLLGLLTLRRRDG